MTENQKHWIAWLIIAIVCTGLATGLGVSFPIPPPPHVVPQGTTHLSGLNVTGAVDFDTTLNVDGASTLVGATTVTGALTGSGLVDVGTWINLSAATNIALGAGGVITPTGTYQTLSSSGAVTCSTTKCVEDGTRIGDLLILRNKNAADAITIDGTGANVECKADVPLGAADTLTLIWNGTDWNCVAYHDNS